MTTKQTVSILGCGWLGLPLAKFLVKQGFDVKGSTTTPEKIPLLEKENISPYLLDGKPELTGRNIKDFFQADILIITLPFKRNFEDPNIYQQQIDSVIKQCELSDRLDFVIFTSSTVVYPQSITYALEEYPISPDNMRTKVLLDVERELFYHPHFDTTILRLAGLYGPGRPIGKFLAGKQNVAGGNHPVNLVHLDDVVGVIEKVIRQDVRGEILNVCADGHPSRRELYARAAEKMGLTPPTFSDDDSVGKTVSNHKLKARLGYQFKYPDPAV
ncbi:MAG: SDR family oxidoreductase [Candidatus Omnitrophica bacterium]|nr:SDR family oxidoreductase [Candidatus Omnitrophota bacterium]